MNRRNAACILDHNPRAAYPVVDDKLRMARLCGEIGVATPAVYAVAERHSQLRRIDGLLGGRDDFVRQAEPRLGRPWRPRPDGPGGIGLSPAQRRGSSRPTNCGNTSPTSFPGCTRLAAGRTRRFSSSGSGCIRRSSRSRIRASRTCESLLYRGEPAMAMLRLPTRESGGRANLHQGGIGAGVDLDDGRDQSRRSATTGSSARTPIPVRRLSAEPCPFGRRSLTWPGAWRRRSGSATSASTSSSTRRPARCCWRPTPGPGWRSRSPTMQGLVPRLAAIDNPHGQPVVRRQDAASGVTMLPAGRNYPVFTNLTAFSALSY